MTRCLVLGKQGQVASALSSRSWPSDWFINYWGKEFSDFRAPAVLSEQIKSFKPDIIINCAAYTAVDRAESEPELADLINHLAVKSIGRTATQIGIPVIHVSTEYVFDGTLDRPYRENDNTNPINVYGKSKWLGEQGLMDSGCHAVILRTSWVFYEKGTNFVRRMIELADRPTLNIVDDQIGSPTYAAHLACAIQVIAGRLINDDFPTGIFHASAASETSWYHFAQAIFEGAGPNLDKVPRLDPIESKDYPTPARRPKNSRLNCEKLATLGIRLPSWQEGLKLCLGRIFLRE